MATTISTDSPKLTANIADHADVYGGRALVFDGVSDYLDCGDIDTSGNFSFSCWFNADSVTGHHMIFSMSDQSTSDGMSCGFYSGKGGKIYATANHGSTSSTKITSVLSTGQWYHLVVTKSSGQTENIYINGASDTNSADSNWGLADETVIGSRNAGSNFLFNGKISDVKLFNSILTEAQVQELYLKPENTPSAVQDSLLAWYPMIESNPESPQSIVYDHSEKKLDSNILANGTFDTDISGWVNSSPDTTSSTDFRTITHATIDGRTCIDINDQSEGVGAQRMHAYYNLGSSLLKQNTLYKISYYARKSQSDSTTKEYAVALGHLYIGITAGTVFKSVSEWDTWEYHELYIISSTSNYTLQFLNTAFNNGIYNEHKGRLFLDDIKVQKVLMGNHAQTKFFSTVDEIEDGAFDTNTSANTVGAYWQTELDWVIESGVATCTLSSSANRSIYQSSSNGSVSANPLTAGKTYRVTGTVVVTTLNGYLAVGSAGSNFYTVVPSDTADGATVNFDEEIVANTGMIQIRCTGNGGANNFTLNNFTAKEVGVSSTGFATAQEEPTIPQVPLLKYNQKMHFNGHYLNLPSTLTSASNYTLVAWINTLNTGQAHLFMGASGNDNFQMHSGRIWWYQDADHYSTTYINDGKTYMIAYQREGNNYSIWVNGIKETSWTQTSQNDYQTFQLSKIGSSNGSRPYKGLINDVSAWNTALSSSEMQELFNDGVALDATTHSKSGNLLAYYRNDGVTTWKDRRGWSYLTLDGTGDYITLGNPSNFPDNPDGEEFTITAWVNLPSGADGTIFSKADNSNRAIQLYSHTDDELIGKIGGTELDTNTVIADGNWHHVVLRSFNDGGTYKSEIYVDGVFKVVGTTGTTTATDRDFLIGARRNLSNTDSAYLLINSSISSVSIYNNAKSPSEILALFNAGINSSEASNSNLIGYWKLDTESTDANAIKDLSSNSNDGTVNGNPTLNTGNNGTVAGSPDSITIREGLNSNKDGLGFPFTNPTGNVLRLNGVNEYVVAPDTDLSLSEQITIECWAKNNSADLATEEYLVNQYETISGANRSWLFRMLSDEKLRVVWSSDGTNYSLTSTSSAITNVNTWRHYVATIASGVAKIYVDGEAQTIDSVSSNSSLQTSLHNSVANIFVGRYANNNDQNWNGLIDEVKIYNRKLELSEIQKNYKHQKGKHKND